MFTKKENDETSIWISTTDLMSGLLVLFLFVAISMTKDLQEKKEEIKNISESSYQTRQEFKNNLKKNFSEEDIKKYNIGLVGNDIGHISVPDNKGTFAPGSSSLTPEFKEALNDFLPGYIKSAYDSNLKSGGIKEIRIEGHTSSEWGSATGNLAYFMNMKLSQDRTREVLNYAFTIPKLVPYHDFMKEKITANGLSSSQVKRDKNNKEDRVASRRIEFRIVTNDEKVLDEVRKAAQKSYKEN